MKRALGLLGMVFTLMSCESEYGISREVQLHDLPDIACVRSALSSVEGVKVTDERAPSAGVLDRSTPGLVRFRYEYDDCFAYLTIRVDPTGQIQLLHDRLTINAKPRIGEIKRTRAVMEEVERSISKCGFGDDLASIKERCNGTECK